MQSLEFTSTYLVGIVVAFCLSVAAVYFLGTFGDETQPRRILLPLSFALFAPSSLLIRRVLGARVARSTERKGALLVIGSGEDAMNSTDHTAAWAILTQSASSIPAWTPIVRSSWMDQARLWSIPSGSAGSPSSDRATTQSSLRETRPNSRRHSHKSWSIFTFTRFPF